MGIFSGILLCTDFDNSLVHDLKMLMENIEAIKRFKREGGLFTVISGRSEEVLGRFGADAAPNTYLGLFNGTVIYDPFNCTVVSDDALSDLCIDKVLKINEMFDDFSITVCAKEKFVRIKSKDEDIDQKLSECRALHVRKYYFHREAHFENDAYNYFCELFGSDFDVTRSSIKGIEVQNAGANKGAAALKIKELTGAHTLVCVGDYENDISMIKAADIGYAVENACEPLKAVADRITVHCKDSAIAAIIAELEAELKSK
jgi:HAD superfamily hydrolase (TIGR01484 family)